MRAIDAVARTHLGLINLQQWRSLGYSDRSWVRACGSGRLLRVSPTVARLPGSAVTRRQAILAAVYAAGPDARASHRSAALVWGVDRPASDPVDVIVARGRHPTAGSVVVHRPTDIADLAMVRRGPLPVVGPLRMLLDLGAVDPRGVRSALDTMLGQRIVTFDAVERGLVEHSRRGRAGIGPLRLALDERRIDGRPADSELETVMHRLALRFGLPPLVFHAPVAGYEVDFLVRGTRVVIECDGWRSHGLNDDQFEFDRVRGAALTAAGYVVLHVTWRQVTREPGKVAARIRAALAAFSGWKTTETVVNSPENGG